MRHFTIAIVAAAVASGACSSDDSDNVPQPPAADTMGTMTARINGVPWTATSVGASFAPGNILVIEGSNPGHTPFWTVSISVSGLTATGSYPLQVAAPPRVAVLSNALNVWSTAIDDGAGTFTLNSLTAARTTGTFTFVAAPDPQSGAVSPRTVSEGTFDIRFPAD